MTQALDFYFDFSSPYAYFASTRIEALASKYGRKVNWHPILLGVVFKATGVTPAPLVPMKADYAKRDIERTARLHGIPFKRPVNFPASTQLAARAILWLQQTQGDAKAVEFIKAVYRAYFADGIDITDADAMVALANANGLDGQALVEAANSAPIKGQLKANMEAAIARKVFGAPMIFADNEPFWGFDRFDQLDVFLKNGKI